MAEVRSGSFETTGYSDAYSPDHYVFSWSLSSQSIADNTSTITWSVVAAGGSTSGYYNTVRERYVTVNGVTKSASDAQVSYNGTTPFSGTSVIKHDNSGKGSFSASCGGAFEYGGSYNSTGSGSWTLPTIARSTSPTYSATTVEMGKSITITLNPATSSFKHKVAYAFGTLTEQTSGVSIGSGFSAAGNVTVTFTPPTSLGSQIPNVTSGVCKVTCSTYTSAGALVGSVTTNVTLTIPSYTPTVTGITLTGNSLLSSTYVQGKSTVTVAATVGTSYGAGTKSITTVIDGKSYSGLPFTTSTLTSGSKTAAITFVDTRDKSVTVTSSAITVYDYSLPNITDFTLARQSDGTTVIATVKGTIASVNSKNAKTIKVTLNGVTNTITSSSYTISATTTFTGISTDKTFAAKATFTDSYVSVERESTVPTVAVTMDFLSDGKGVALGKVAETTDLLDVAWSQRVRKNLTVDGTATVTGKLTAGSLSTSGSLSVGSLTASGALSSATLTTSGNATVGGTLGVTGATTLSKASTISDDVLGILTLKRNHASNGASIKFQNNTSVLGYIGMTGSANGGLKRWNATDTNTAYTFLDTGNLTNTIKDYITEEGGSGAWWYRKWNNGDMEVFGTLSQTPTSLNNGTNSITASLPVSFVDTSFVVNITPAKCGLMISAFGDCNSSNDKTHTVNSFVLSYKYNYSTAYTVNFNVTIVGKWK